MTCLCVRKNVRGKMLAFLVFYPNFHAIHKPSFTQNVVLNDFPKLVNVVFQTNQKRLSLVIVIVTKIRKGESKKAALPNFIL